LKTEFVNFVIKIKLKMRNIFLLYCTLYNEERTNLFDICKRVFDSFENMNDEEKFVLLLTEKTIVKSIAYFTRICYKKRS
jgi:hypothetical protein